MWIPPEDLEERANSHLAWETANPEWWCPRRYACVRVDARGSGKSPGQSDPSSYAEAVDFYDAIEWIAKRDWCSGNIGTLGVSYHANCQWRWEMGQQGHDEVPVTKGWLRASQRKLDPEKSLPYRPYHAHTERQWLERDQPVECQVEIWPTSMLFRKGHRIRLDVQPRDGVGASA